jgi:hypothetical protein
MAAAAMSTLSKIMRGAPVPAGPATPPPPPAALASLKLVLAGARARVAADEPPPTTERVPSSPRASSRPPPEVRVERVAVVPLTAEEDAALRTYQRDGRGSRELRGEADKARTAFDREEVKFDARAKAVLDHQLYALQARHEVLVHARMADDETPARHEAAATEARRGAANALDNMRLFAGDFRDLLGQVHLLEGAQEKAVWNKATESQPVARPTKEPLVAVRQADAALLADLDVRITSADARMRGPSPGDVAAAEARVTQATGRPVLRRGWVVIAMGEGSGQRLLTDLAVDLVDGHVQLDRRWGGADIVAGPYRDREEVREQLRRLHDRHLTAKQMLDIAKALAVPRRLAA